MKGGQKRAEAAGGAVPQRQQTWTERAASNWALTRLFLEIQWGVVQYMTPQTWKHYCSI